METHAPRSRPFLFIGIEILCAIALIVFAFQFNFYAVDSDLTYHLATAQSFVRDGGVGLQETWDSLPLGRPHLYPPVIHILLSPLLYLPVSIMAVIKAFNALSVIGIIALSWLSLSKLFNWKYGAIYLLILTSNVIVVRIVGSTIPASLVLFLSPALLLLIKRRKNIAAVLLLTLFLYTHMIFPWIVIAGLAAWAFWNREYLVSTRRIVVASVALYFPWLLHVASNLEYLRYFGPSYRAVVQTTITYSLDLTIVVLYVAAVGVIAYRYVRYRELKNRDIVYFAAIPILALPIAYFEFSRYSYSVGIWPMIVVVAYGICEYGAAIFAWCMRVMPGTKKYAIALVILLLAFSFYVDSNRGSIDFKARPHLFVAAIAKPSRYYLGRAYVTHFNATNIAIADVIRKNTSENGVILSYGQKLDTERYQPHRLYIMPQLFAALSDRRMANLRSPEYLWQEGIRPEQANIIIFNWSDGKIPVELAHLDPKQFPVIARTRDGVTVVKNTAPEFLQLPDPRIILPLWLAWLMVGGAIAYILFAFISLWKPTAGR